MTQYRQVTADNFGYLVGRRNHKHVIWIKQESHHTFPEVYTDNHLGEREKIMRVAPDVLSEKERRAILLFEIGRLSLEEIMKVQKEKSISAIKSRLSRTRLKLRNTIVRHT